MDAYDHLFKIVVVGNSGVGKSSLITRYVEQDFCSSHKSTIGVDFLIRTLKVGDKSVKLQLWDTAGQERYKSVSLQFFRLANAVIFVFDVTDPDSFLSLPTWMKEVRSHAPEEVDLFLIGNKVDLDRNIDQDLCKSFAIENEMEYFETSAKTGYLVDSTFEKIALNLTLSASSAISEPSLPNGLAATTGRRLIRALSFEPSDDAVSKPGCCSVM